MMANRFDPAGRVMTTGNLARRLGEQGYRTADGGAVRDWMIRRALDAGGGDPRPRLGRYRPVLAEDVPLILASLRRLGYLSAYSDPPTC